LQNARDLANALPPKSFGYPYLRLNAIDKNRSRKFASSEKLIRQRFCAAAI